jgi:DegV family protein with EDD domain
VTVPPVGIVTDSTSDIDPAVARHLGISVVPLFVNFGERRYRDGVDLSREAFYHMLATERELPTTAQPTAKMFEEALAPLAAAGRSVVGVFISQKLSGTINAARAAADQFPGTRIELVDSLTTTAGLGLQAIHAAELAREGAGVDEILAALAVDRSRLHGYASLPDLSQAVRTGRIGKARAAIGTLLKIVPVLRLDRGEVEEEARVRTFARAQETMIASTVRTIGDVARARVQVMHSHAPELGADVLRRLRARLTGEPLSMSISDAGPVIAVHAGQGAVGIFSIAG